MGVTKHEDSTEKKMQIEPKEEDKTENEEVDRKEVRECKLCGFR